MSRTSTDVVIVGSGFAGGTLAAVLARHGVGVVILDRAPHPRFAIGESNVPETSAMLKLAARRYDVPELAKIADFHRAKTVAPGCGIKRHAAFCWHRAGERQRGVESHMFPTWAVPFGPDVHYFRQDTDAYLYHVALRYGAEGRIPAEVSEVHFDDDSVRVSLAGGDEIIARYLVDATGPGSPVVRQLGLRAPMEALRTNSRTVFTHMVGVKPYDAVGPSPDEHGLPYAFHEGTLQHVFDGGWMWVIPFDNHPGASNPLASVGVCFDNDRVPTEGGRPADVFAGVLARFPSIAAQFDGAAVARPWVASPRMQHRTTAVFGDRYCLLPHTAGFIDPLFSGGLSLTTWMLNRLPARLMAALADGGLGRERFEDIGADLGRNFDYYDGLVARSYIAFRDFSLWDAWFRVWVLTSNYGLSGTQRVFGAFANQGPEALEMFEADPFATLQGIGFAPLAAVYESAGGFVDRYGAGELSAEEAREGVYAALRDSGLCPAPWGLTDPARRYPTVFTLPRMTAYLKWGRDEAPPVVRETYFGSGRGGAGFGKLIRTQLFGEAWRQGSESAAQVYAFLRDSVRATPWSGQRGAGRPGMSERDDPSKE